MNEMTALLRDRDADETSMLALLRDKYLDIEAISAAEGYDITGDVMACPKHVVYYVAKYGVKTKKGTIN